MAQWIGRKLAELGVTHEVFKLDSGQLKNHPGYLPSPYDVGGRYVVCARIPGSGSGQSLVLNSHIDAVPIDPDSRWDSDPYLAKWDEGKIFGRGAWDDKAGIVMILAMAEWCMANPLSGDLVLQFVPDDEMSGNGTLSALIHGYIGDGAIIVDGTWPERIVDSHMGQVWFQVNMQGKTAPSCVASRGINPIEAFAGATLDLKTLEERWNKKGTSRWGTMDNPNFVIIGQIQGGGSPFSVPAAISFSGQAGFTPPFSYSEAVAEIEATIKGAALASGLNESAIEFTTTGFDWLSPDRPNVLVQGLKSVIESMTDQEVLISSVTGHCDLRHFVREGMPACLYGPGGGKNAHVENEYYMWDHFPIVLKRLRRFAETWMV